MSEVRSFSQSDVLYSTDRQRAYTVTGARPFYDLTNPVIYQRDEATITPIEEDAKALPIEDAKALPTRRKPRISGEVKQTSHRLNKS